MTEHIDTEYNFVKNVNSDQLNRELLVFCAQMNAEEDSDLELIRIETVGDALSIWFNQTLSENAETQLNALLDAYVFVGNYVPPEQQDQIDTLIAYLTNPSPLIMNTARAVVVLNLAPRLGPELIATINAQIATKLGT